MRVDRVLRHGARTPSPTRLPDGARGTDGIQLNLDAAVEASASVPTAGHPSCLYNLQASVSAADLQDARRVAAQCSFD